MGEKEFEPSQELENEEVLDSEVKEILSRLSASELGGSELATVRAICEATGATPLLVGRMLAEIRQSNLDERFGYILKRHEKDLRSHGRQLEVHQREIQQIRSMPTNRESPTEYSDEVDEELVRMAEERIRERESAPWMIAVGFVVFLLAWTFTCNSANTSSTTNGLGPPSRFSTSTTTKDGRVITVDQDLNATVREPSGLVRPPKANEEPEVNMLMSSHAKRQQGGRRY